MHVIELGAQPGDSDIHQISWCAERMFATFNLLLTSHWRVLFFSGKPGFTKKQADLFFPPDFADDFPVAMQVELLAFLP